jgi:hypothetical protein
MFFLYFAVDAMMMFHDVSTDTDETQGDPCVASIDNVDCGQTTKPGKEGKGRLKKRSSSHNPAIPLSEKISLRPVILRHHLTMVLP